MRRSRATGPAAARRPAGIPAASLAGPLAGCLLAAISLFALAAAARAQDEDTAGLVTPDSVFTETSQPPPQYQTTFDGDRTRNNWTQSLVWQRNTGRFALNTSGSMNTQELTDFANKSTFGNIAAHLDTRMTRRWVVTLDGSFDMNSSTDGTRTSDSRRDRLKIRTQYQLNPLKSLSLLGGLYTEFQRDHDRTLQQSLRPASSTGDSSAVDTLFAQRDSSETTGRQDGVLAVSTWQLAPWLLFTGGANSSRIRPAQTSIVRNFTNPLDASGGGFAQVTRQSSDQPSRNSSYSSRLTFTKIPRSKTEVRFDRNAVSQSFFDKDFRDQERADFDRSSATGHVEYGPFRKLYMTTDVGWLRSSRDYRLRSRSNSLVTTRSLTTAVARSDTTGRLGITYTVARSRNERQASQNGIVLDRTLGGSFMRRMSRRLTLDGIASAGLSSSQYVASDRVGDQDIARSMVSVGGGYLLAPACSTTVHFSTNRSHTVSIDPSASGSNAVSTNYQMNATLLLRVTSTLTVTQNYLLSADYRIFDFDAAERNNYLNRTRRIDTNVVDSLFSFAFLQMTHNFVFRDQGPYARDPGQTDRTYRVTQENYEQTLGVTGGLRITGGVRVIVTQSLYNQRNHFLVQRTRTSRNRFALTAGFEVNRSFRDGSQIVGAVRHIGGYDERLTPLVKPNEDNYWIAGATYQKSF